MDEPLVEVADGLLHFGKAVAEFINAKLVNQGVERIESPLNIMDRASLSSTF